jgi:hypothetical protein
LLLLCVTAVRAGQLHAWLDLGGAVTFQRPSSFQRSALALRRKRFEFSWGRRHVEGDRLAKACEGIVDIDAGAETALDVETPQRRRKQRADLAGVTRVDGDSIEELAKLL